MVVNKKKSVFILQRATLLLYRFNYSYCTRSKKMVNGRVLYVTKASEGAALGEQRAQQTMKTHIPTVTIKMSALTRQVTERESLLNVGANFDFKKSR